MSSNGTERLRIGVLGAARICSEAVVGPAHAGGHRLVAVAARDRSRAEAFAAEHGVERVVDDYLAVITDPEVDVVYNPLPNALHGHWNAVAAQHGKHVLTEKPSAVDAAEARGVLEVVREHGVVFLEGFHYFHHPVTRRLVDLLRSGELGGFRRVEVDMYMPDPGASDPRWSGELAGGSLMDLGCYGLHFARQLAEFAGGEPTAVATRGGVHPDHPDVDEWLDVDLVFPSGATATVRSRMSGADWRQTIDVIGGAGSAHSRSFVKVDKDDRVDVVTAAGERTEHHGLRPTYEFQLELLADHLANGTPLPWDDEDPVRQAELLDSCFALEADRGQAWARRYVARHGIPA